MYANQKSRLCVTLMLLCVAVVVTGCEDGMMYPEGEVLGKVTFRAAPVTQGQVTFYDAQTGAGASAPLEPDGTFKMPAPLRTGKYRVMVTPPLIDIAPGEPGNDAAIRQARAAKYPNIPAKVRSQETTPLAAEVTEGVNEVNFDLLKPLNANVHQ